MRKPRRLALLVSSVAVLGVLAGAPFALRAVQAAEPDRRENVDATFREIYFAVLEGLYRDGAPNEAVDGLLVQNDDGGAALFVPGCGICTPVLNALRVYRARPEIVGFKFPFDTFGPGLSDDVVAACTSADVNARFDALGLLVERWIAERVAARRLTPDERAAFAQEMELLRKKGMAGLGPQSIGGKTTTFERCASCDAANRPFDY